MFDRPLVFFDLETTGNDRNKDRIIEFSFIKVEPGSGNHDVILEDRVDPQMPISPQATQVHGIKDKDVSICLAFRFHAGKIMGFLEGCDLVGFGILLFDIPVLFNEFQRAGLYWDYTAHRLIDSCNIYKRQTPRDLSSAVRFYLNKEHEGAHGATADALAVRKLFFTQLLWHQELPNDPASLALYSNHDKPIVDISGKFTTNDQGEILLNFGPHRGAKASDHIDFLYWILQKDFPKDVKTIAEKIIDEQRSLYLEENEEMPF